MSALGATSGEAAAVETATPPPPRGLNRTIRGTQAVAGWLFVAPAAVILVVFLVVPIVLALFVSFTDWSGLTNPLTGGAHWVGLDNYKSLLTEPGLTQSGFMTSLRNNFYYVLFVVPA